MAEATDLVFALDSIPAIFGITTKEFIVFTSNVFAILGLRSLYFVLSGAIEYFRFLKFGLSLVLVFIGAKMLLPHPPGRRRIREKDGLPDNRRIHLPGGEPWNPPDRPGGDCPASGNGE